MRPLFYLYVGLLYFLVGSLAAPQKPMPPGPGRPAALIDPLKVKGVDVWFYFDAWGVGEGTVRRLQIIVVGGWRIRRENLIQWFEQTNGPDGQYGAYGNPVGNHIASAFYEHMIQYLNYNGFNMARFDKEGRFSETELDATLPYEPYGPNRGAFGIILKVSAASFPLVIHFISPSLSVSSIV